MKLRIFLSSKEVKELILRLFVCGLWVFLLFLIRYGWEEFILTVIIWNLFSLAVLLITFFECAKKWCFMCSGNAKYRLTDYTCGNGQKPNIKELKCCFKHFTKIYKEKLIQYSGNLVFLREYNYAGNYGYLDLRDLRSAGYPERDIIRISQIIESIDDLCKICQKNKTSIILLDARAIRSSIQAPLIKDESYLKLNDSFCIKCFIQFLIQDIRKHRYNFDILLGQKIRVDLPYGQNGIYL